MADCIFDLSVRRISVTRRERDGSISGAEQSRIGTDPERERDGSRACDGNGDGNVSESDGNWAGKGWDWESGTSPAGTRGLCHGISRDQKYLGI